jgi:hypothetical protein
LRSSSRARSLWRHRSRHLRAGCCPSSAGRNRLADRAERPAARWRAPRPYVSAVPFCGGRRAAHGAAAELMRCPISRPALPGRRRGAGRYDPSDQAQAPALCPTYRLAAAVAAHERAWADRGRRPTSRTKATIGRRRSGRHIT